MYADCCIPFRLCESCVVGRRPWTCPSRREPVHQKHRARLRAMRFLVGHLESLKISQGDREIGRSASENAFLVLEDQNKKYFLRGESEAASLRRQREPQKS